MQTLEDASDPWVMLRTRCSGLLTCPWHPLGVDDKMARLDIHFAPNLFFPGKRS